MEAQMRRRIDMAVRPAPLAQGMHGHRQGPGGGAQQPPVAWSTRANEATHRNLKPV